MKNLKKVTILGIFTAMSLLFLNCGSGGKRVVQDGDAEPKRTAVLEAEAREKCMREAIGLYEQGDMDKAKEILLGVLCDDPSQPEALRYLGYLKKSRFCTVYPNDTLSVIADYYYGKADKWSVIARANRIEDPRELKVYQRLRIPWFPECKPEKDELGRVRKKFYRGRNPTKIVVYPVKKGDSLGALAKRYYKDSRLRFFLADFNRMEDVGSIKEGSSLKIPVFPTQGTRKEKKNRDRELLATAGQALSKKEYGKAWKYLEKIPKGSSRWSDAKRLMDQCKREGVFYYDLLGDQALEASDPEKACFYWQHALSLDPGDEEIRKKLEDAEELLKTLKVLAEVP